METPQGTINAFLSWAASGSADSYPHLLKESLSLALLRNAGQSMGSDGGRIITSADGAVTGDFAYLDPLTSNVAISAITLKAKYPSPSATRLIAVSPLPARPIAIEFTSITLSAGTAILYNTVV